MYLFAFLSLTFCVYNLVIGNYVEAIVGTALAIILSTSKFFWDSTKGLSKLERLSMPVRITILVIAISFITIILLEKIEIGSEKYVQVAETKLNFPKLNELIHNAMEDGKISIAEYHGIQKQHKELRKVKAIKQLTEK
jgi:hypothetical protein